MNGWVPSFSLGLFGALAMRPWGIGPVPDEERLDLSHYPDEFVAEYTEDFQASDIVGAGTQEGLLQEKRA